MTAPTVISVALPVPLYKHFDYLAPAETQPQSLKIGTRVRVQFGSRRLIGLIINTSAKSLLPTNKLKQIEEVLDEEAILDQALLKLLFWSADYYQQAIGEVLFTALPSVLRKGKFITPESNTIYQLSSDKNLDELLKRAPKQNKLRIC